MVDRHNFQTFLPLLYQVSTAGLAADHVVHPIRGALRKTGAKFRMGSPIAVDHKNKTVKLDSSEVLEFDHLVVALGSATADFGVPGVSEYALGMKSVNEAITIRASVMRRLKISAALKMTPDCRLLLLVAAPQELKWPVRLPS